MIVFWYPAKIDEHRPELLTVEAQLRLKDCSQFEPMTHDRPAHSAFLPSPEFAPIEFDEPNTAQLGLSAEQEEPTMIELVAPAEIVLLLPCMMEEAPRQTCVLALRVF